MTIAFVCKQIDDLGKQNQELKLKVATLTTERDTAKAVAHGRRP